MLSAWGKNSLWYACEWQTGRLAGIRISFFDGFACVLWAWGRKKAAAFLEVPMDICFLCILLLKMDGGFQVTMLDVGQGDCIYIRSGEGKHYLIDAGSSTKKDMMEYQVIPYLKFMGVEHLEAIFVTHLDSDHCGGVFDLLEEYPMQGLTIGSLILPDIGRESADNSYEEMENLAGEKRVKVQYMSRGRG